MATAEAGTSANEVKLDDEFAGFRSSMLLFVNGKKIELADVQPEVTLLAFLRSLGLSGTKLGCGEGGCGACTVMVSSFEHGRVVHRSVNACLAPLCSVDSCAVTTVEGIGGTRRGAGGLHPVQERIAKMHGSQCGFCTPGIVMALYTFLRNNPRPTASQIEDSMDGNLCRCTGYRPILDAAKTFATDTQGCCGGRGGSGCCMSAAKESADGKAAEDVAPTGFYRVVSTTTSKLASDFLAKTYDGDAELVFPSYLQVRHKVEPLQLVGKKVTWYRPTTVDQLVAIRRRHPDSKIIGGATEISIETRFKGSKYPVRVHIGFVEALRAINVHEPGTDGAPDARGGLSIGGAVTLAETRVACKKLIAQRPKEARTLSAIEDMLKWFASTQIRNVALFAGNVATASPVSDLNPTLFAVGALINIVDTTGAKRVEPIESFFRGYRTTALKAGDFIESIFLPFARPMEYVMGYQQARRREDDIALVGAAYRVQLAPSEDGSAWIVKQAGCGVGSMAATTKGAPETMAWITGKPWNRDTLEQVLDRLNSELALPENVPGGMPHFRTTAVGSFFFKFFINTSLALNKDIQGVAGVPPPVELDDKELSAGVEYHRDVSTGTQVFDVPESQLATITGSVDDATRATTAGAGAGAGAGTDTSAAAAAGAAKIGAGAVGGGYKHPSAEVQVAGEALYTDDVRDPAGCAHAAMVTSSEAHARITGVDTTAAAAAEGFVAYIDHRAIPEGGANGWGIASYTEELVFAESEVQHMGQLIGLVIAETRAQAEAAAKLVKVTYEPLPALISIDECVEAGSFIGPPKTITHGDVDAALAAAEHTAEETVYVGGQEHFYLETNCAIAVPEEAGTGMVIYASTQAATKTQTVVAHVLGLGDNHVVCRVKRLGGGFGGKESRTVPFSAAIAIAAQHLERPVRINVERDMDMLMTGQRHAFRVAYKAAFTGEGVVTGVRAQLFCNAGHSPDLSQAVLDRAMFHIENAYDFKSTEVTGRLVKSNIASHTAFRGFGGPQGMMLGESLMDKIATTLNLPADVVRQRNLYKSGSVTHYLQRVDHWYVPEMWTKLMASAEVPARRAKVEAFNAANRHRKRGLCVMPTKYGINFTAKFLNQAGALVHIYTDGSVLITHGGVEMGQGLHIKIIQIAAHELGTTVANCHINETATDKVPNTSPTAASASSDLYGGAVRDACRQLKERLKPYEERMPDATFQQRARAAYFERVNLSAQGFYATPNAGYDFNEPDPTKRGTPFSYFTNGVAVSEVEVDTLTGDFHILRSDVLMDLGCTLNPVIDIGQIEGAFVQGMGWCTMEECVWGDKAHKWMKPGSLLTRGPGFYKIPSFNDVPIDFRISLLADAPNPAAVHSSKAVGEPPFFMAASVFFAIKDAIYAARKESGVEGHFTLDLPATAERIRMACTDKIVARRLGSAEAAASYRVPGSF